MVWDLFTGFQTNFQWSMKNFSPGQQFATDVKANRIFFLIFIARSDKSCLEVLIKTKKFFSHFDLISAFKWSDLKCELSLLLSITILCSQAGRTVCDLCWLWHSPYCQQCLWSSVFKMHASYPAGRSCVFPIINLFKKYKQIPDNRHEFYQVFHSFETNPLCVRHLNNFLTKQSRGR